MFLKLRDVNKKLPLTHKIYLFTYILQCTECIVRINKWLRRFLFTFRRIHNFENQPIPSQTSNNRKTKFFIKLTNQN